MVAHRSRYSHLAIVLHWVIAAFILVNIAVGWRMGGLKGMAQFEMFQWHKSIGITVLLLSIVRLGWRLGNPGPPHPHGMTALERSAATTMHWLLYALMIILPMTGWVIVSASAYNLPTLLFKTLPWPHIGFIHDLPTATRLLIDHRVSNIHMWLAWSMLALAAFHVAAALKHQFWDRDNLLARMAPNFKRQKSPIEAE